MNNEPFVLIMAGGVGSRFWPASRENLPKQFLDISGSGKTLIQSTFDRFASFIPLQNIYVITHENYTQQTIESLPELYPGNVITEPSRNNTAASIALGSFILSQKNKEAICIVAASDHIISDDHEMERLMHSACMHADAYQCLVTLGIKPTRPDTGYGYMEFASDDDSAIRRVTSFREKPNATDALFYMESGNFLWNSGIFIWRLVDILDAYREFSPGIFKILSKGEKIYGTEGEQAFITREYPKTENIAVDYAILEKAKNVFAIPCDIGWSDLGTWNSLFDINVKDENQNAILSAPVYLEETHRTLIKSTQDKLVVIKGLEDYIVVDTEDCLMIFPKSEEQNIKELKEKLKEKGLDSYL